MTAYVNDALGATGLGMLFTGLWWVYPPAAMIVVGGVVAAVGIAGALR